jgi:hypothetical protein
MTKKTRLLAVTCAVLAALLSAVIASTGDHGGTTPAVADSTATVDTAAVSAASTLTKAPLPSAASMAAIHTAAADLRASGTRLEIGVPLPPGGRFDIDWDAAAAQGGDNESGMQGVILHQAACQWYQYALTNGVSPATTAVLNSIPNWPAFRGQDYAQTLTEVAQSITSGDKTLARAHVALNCRVR